MSGRLASIATAGSFWWFCGVRPAGLAVLTRALVVAADASPAVPVTRATVTSERRTHQYFRNSSS
jgi:hypothetical protein